MHIFTGPQSLNDELFTVALLNVILCIVVVIQSCTKNTDIRQCYLTDVLYKLRRCDVVYAIKCSGFVHIYLCKRAGGFRNSS